MNLTMSAPAKQEILPFPFDKLPQLDLARQELFERLGALYGFVASQEDLLEDLTKTLSEMLESTVTARLAGVSVQTAEEWQQALPTDFLLQLLRVEPQGKKAFLLFDLALAQCLVEAALGGAEAAGTPLALAQIKPVTPLSEAVLSYITASLMELLSARLQKSQLKLGIDRVLHEARDFALQVAGRERFAVFVVTISHAGHEFYLKFGLPLTLCENFFEAKVPDEFYGERFKSFTDFKIPFDVEIGRVSLSRSEFLALSEGDIILLDEVELGRVVGRWQGKASLLPSGGPEAGGYQVHFEMQPDLVRLKVTGVL